MLYYWLGFIACTSAIVYSGSRLSKYGDILSEKLGLGKAWIGLVLLASVTSLPELVTGISSVTVAGTPDIAVGDVMGSCVFNLLLLVVIDAMYRETPLSTKAHQGNVLSAAFGIILISIAGANLYAGEAAPSIGWVGIYSLVFIIVYLIAIRLIFVYEKRNISTLIHEIAEEVKYKEISTKAAFFYYGLNAAVVFGAAVFLPFIGKGLAEHMGLGETFVGNVFIALTTSLPELVVSIAAVKMGAVDLAIGNLFGSNIFNICILSVDDFFFIKGPIFLSASPGHLVSALSAVAMTAIAVVGLSFRQEKKDLLLSWDSIGIAMVYIMNLMFLYMMK